MKSKSKVILTGVILILTISLIIVCMFIPTIEINYDNNTINLEVNETLVDDGAVAYYKTAFSKKEIPVLVKTNLENDKTGSYLIGYYASYNNISKNVKKKIVVVDTEKPNIEINGEVLYCKKNNILEYDVKAIDNYDNDITDKISYEINDDKIIFKSIDSSKNESTKETNLKVMDNEKPSIELKGKKEITIYENETYKDEGAVAKDFCDGVLTSDIVVDNNVDTTKAGTYYITYSVKNSNGEKNEVKRKVTVLKKKVEIINNVHNDEGAVIYLTFDDGPGAYTEKILNILKENNVKATFFVTNQFPSYQNLIKREYEEGHTVAVHTYTHKWSIYDSVDNYINDFNMMNGIIEKQTGVRSKYFRFPGGSSNTVSKQHKKGIMTELANRMQNDGYRYYDWSFDSGDTNKNDNSKTAIINNVKKYLKSNTSYIILFHDIKKNTMEALPEVIDYGKSLGYTFKAIDDNTPEVHLKIVN